MPSNISNVNISEAVIPSTKMSNANFQQFHICNRMVPLRKFYSVTLTYILKVKIAANCRLAVPADLPSLVGTRRRVALIIFSRRTPSLCHNLAIGI